MNRSFKMEYGITEEEYSRILAFKRDLHMHPELPREEVRTTQKIREFLSGLADFRILDLETETGTGVVAQICGTGTGAESAMDGTGPESARNGAGPGGDGPERTVNEAGALSGCPAGESGLVSEIMLRADIDALPQTEEYESPWKSRTPGVMHACGHDFHTAALLGAALVLQRAREEGRLRTTVDLVFQPAEEGTTGARMMINAGLFDLIHPRVCFGMHNWPSIRTGKVSCHIGSLMAGKRNFRIVIRGAGGHGSMPHLNIDPIVCAAAVVQSLQTVVSRNTDPLASAVLSINRIEGGSPVNVVADQVLLLGTVRSLSDPALDRAISRAQTIVEKTAEAYECRAQITWDERFPTVWNSPEMTAQAKKYARAAGCEVVDAPPSLTSEDFSLYRAHVPCFFYWTGSTAEGDAVEDLHRPRFHTDDAALRYAADLYAASALLSGG